MIKVHFNKLLILAICLYASSAIALEQEHRNVVKSFIEAVKSNNRAKVANYISYPLGRDLPIPSIKNKRQFLERYDEVFDENLIKMIVGSDLEKDWDAVGWRGIMLGNGQLWLDYDGKILSINHQSKAEETIKNKLLKVQKNTLHHSVSEYVEPILEWKTKKFTIRVDDLNKQNYRYVAWAVNKKTSEKPDLILFDGEVTFDGSGGNHSYTFSNGIYQYKCFVNIIGTSETPAGELEVYKNDKLILSDPVIKVLGE